ncbi:MAG: DUF4167 domain-containing protein [Bdellovibrionales bacterium]
MRQASGRRSSRGGRHHGNSRSNGVRGVTSLRHQNFDSNGPDVRVRGNAKQVYEKYLSLARDARGTGDHILAENLLQHAEHYYRITEAIEEAAEAEQRRHGPVPQFDDEQPDMPDNYYTPEGKLLDEQEQTFAETDDEGEDEEKPAPRRVRPSRGRSERPERPMRDSTDAVVERRPRVERRPDPFMPQDADESDLQPPVQLVAES